VEINFHFIYFSSSGQQYDPKSRYTFAEVAKKLTLLLDNQNGSIMNTSATNSINSSNSSLNGLPTASSVVLRNGYNKRNSVDSTTLSSGQVPLINRVYNQSISESPKQRRENGVNRDLQVQLIHRRSLSEHVITSPIHTVPADKARCHMLNRANSKLQESTGDLSTVAIPTYSNVTLRKVGETMFLKDPQYKPRPKEDSKLNPFAALAQLRGVKKIIGANAAFTPGAGDLFSSCFEMSSPFLRNLKELNGTKDHHLACEHPLQPKSLPSSPLTRRKDFNADALAVLTHEAFADGSKCSGKKCFDKLQNHPLYKSGKHETELCNNNSSASSSDCPKAADVMASILPTITKTTIGTSASHSYTKLIDKIEPSIIESCLPQPLIGANSSFYEEPRMLTRRGSTESGFFSCLNEDFCDKTRDLDLTNPYYCNCCLFPSTPASKKDDTSNDSSSISLKSLDDLELSDPRRVQCPNQAQSHGSSSGCSQQRHVDIDARSIDMGLINRLALDTEINSLIQKHQLSNQLFHCKNRTSSIYSDSSDSLAGSDSLLWDDRSYSIPNTRSAQIAKIVEYFERKGANFKASNFAIPSSSSFASSAARNYLPTSNYHHHNKLTDYFVDLRRDFNDLSGGGSGGGASSTGLSGLARQRGYETFCFELSEKKAPQNKICEGLVKSKLQLFDKLKQNPSPEK
jgi:hypothetical protein